MSDPSPIQPPQEDATAPKRRRPALIVRLLFSLFVFAGLLGSLEIAARVFGLGPKPPAVEHYISSWHHTPDGKQFWVVRGPGYNRDGMRDIDREIAKPPNTYRIICLGDSVTLGHGIKRKEAYPFLLESFLRQLQPDIHIEVFNMGVAGWSTLQEAAAYENLARKYHPDQVILGVCLNDVAEMHNNLTKPPPVWLRSLVDHSAFVRFVVDAKGREISQIRDLLSEDESEAVASGWQKVFDQIAYLQRMTLAGGAQFSVIVFPFSLQLKANAPPPIAQQKLTKWCWSLQIPCLDMLPALKEIGPRAMIDESHLSPAGAKAVAEAIIEWGRSGCGLCGLDLSDVHAKTCPRCGWPTGK